MFLCVLSLPGQREGRCPRPVSTITEPTPPPSSAAGPRSLNRAENETESGSTGSGWLSHPGCSADRNTETTSGTTSAAGPQGTRLRTVEKHQGRGSVSRWNLTTQWLYSSVLNCGKVLQDHIHIKFLQSSSCFGTVVSLKQSTGIFIKPFILK